MSTEQEIIELKKRLTSMESEIDKLKQTITEYTRRGR